MTENRLLGPNVNHKSALSQIVLKKFIILGGFQQSEITFRFMKKNHENHVSHSMKLQLLHNLKKT